MSAIADQLIGPSLAGATATGLSFAVALASDGPMS